MTDGLFPLEAKLHLNFLDVTGLGYRPDLLDGAEERRLLAEVDARPWLDDLKRRVQHYGYRYDYSARKVDPSLYLGPLPDWSAFVVERLLAEKVVVAAPDQMIVNEYAPGQGISAHVDCVPCFEDGIVTVSLGWAYEMDLAREKETRTILLDRRSALVFEREARYEWRHSIKARASDRGVPRERRVSLTFRRIKK